jgi:hypothetical protein
MVNNPNIRNQIGLFIDMHREELKARQARAWEQQNQKRNKDLDNLIQVS